MSSASHSMLNQSLFDDQTGGDLLMPPQIGNLFPFHGGAAYNHHHNISALSNPLLNCAAAAQPSIKTLAPPPFSFSADSPLTLNSDQSVITTNHKDGGLTMGGPHILSLHRSPSNYWAWTEYSECMSMKKNEHLGVSAVKMKKMKTRKRVREPRFCFKTMSDVDVLDDGYKWRKYGQKIVKDTQHPRSYYRCTQENCRVKKRVERLADDPRMVITTYEGRHIHSPSHDNEEDSQASSQLNNFFW